MTDTRIDSSKYDELLQDISDVQLGLERSQRAAKQGAVLGILPETVADGLKSMEEYLGDLVTEYEETLPAASESSGISVINLERLNDFIGDYTSGKFRSNFVHPYYRAAESVAKEVEKDLPRGRRLAKKSLNATPGSTLFHRRWHAWASAFIKNLIERAR